MDSRYIFLRKGNYGLWSLQLALTLNIEKVFYIQNLASVPSPGEASFLASGKFACNIITHVSTTFLPSAWHASFAFLGLRLPVSYRPREHDLSGPQEESSMITLFSVIPFNSMDILLEVSLLDQPLDLFLELIKILCVIPINFMELVSPT